MAILLFTVDAALLRLGYLGAGLLTVACLGLPQAHGRQGAIGPDAREHSEYLLGHLVVDDDPRFMDALIPDP